MQLKKLYNRTTKQIGSKQEIVLVPSGKVKILTTPQKQNFSTKFVEDGIKEGWLNISRNALIIVGEKSNAVYRIDRMPGRYPDATSHSGYIVTHAYECTLEEMKK